MTDVESFPAPSAVDDAFGALRDVVVEIMDNPDVDARDSIRPTVSASALTIAARLVEVSQVAKLVERWIVEDRAGRHGGGRPAKISVRAFLTVLVASQIAFMAPTYDQMRFLATRPMDREMRRLVGFRTSDDPDDDAALDRARTRMHADGIRRVMKKVADLMDPLRCPVGRALTLAEHAANDALRDPDDDAQRQLHADEFNTRLLYATTEMWPDDAKSAWKGDVSVDGTTLEVYGKHGNSAYRRAVKDSWHQEPVAYWTRKDKDSRDPGAEPKDARLKKTKKDDWGYKVEVHAVAATGPDVGDEYPGSILGYKYDRPAVAPGLNAVDVLRQLGDLGAPKGSITTDTGYTQTHPQNYAIPARQAGHTLIEDYKREDGGIQTSIEDATFIDGNVYLPCVPEGLARTTEVLRETNDKKTAREQYEERAKYMARKKEFTNDGASLTIQCPAQGPGRTIACPRRLDSMEARRNIVGTDGRPTLSLVVNPIAEDLSCCTNKESFTIAMTDDALKVYQEMPYGTRKHRKAYALRRNQIEKANLDMKTATKAGLKLADHRQKRGYGKSILVITAKIVATNVVGTLTWEQERNNRLATKATKRGRPSKSEVKMIFEQTARKPLRVASRKIPDEVVA